MKLSLEPLLNPLAFPRGSARQALDHPAASKGMVCIHVQHGLELARHTTTERLLTTTQTDSFFVLLEWFIRGIATFGDFSKGGNNLEDDDEDEDEDAQNFFAGGEKSYVLTANATTFYLNSQLFAHLSTCGVLALWTTKKKKN